ncbi:PREDICTED: zinc finger CCCH domain-containing protein 18 isoform X2 [Tarenaya hassleriana]|uniref:zinc finger CCCH domain-containing protein 18 isoform X2 n=1 Tax=Tarenaya hassleriana TaxID=28532 RepID=UPI00053C2165|nr:PREDICTED: zinc finger CCCH domain-containing protein 18 isoform X2 [Tarenaya hassleriana]
MDYSESTKVVFNRIQQLEPEHVAKIIGYLLLQEHGERQMIRLAFCPDSTIHSLIETAKSELGLVRKPLFMSHVPSDHIPIHHQFASFTGSSTPAVSVSPPLSIRNVFWENHQKVSEIDLVQNGVQFLNLDDSANNHSVSSPNFSGSFFSQDQALPGRTSRRSPSLPEFPVKVCHYYNKGFCKHGTNCRYFHGQIMPERESFSQMFSMNSCLNDDEQHIFSPGSLEKLEGEIIELLKSRRGSPISIASLPMMYYEKFGKTLQAEGYLTESQRHGKAGYSLTKLLARLKNNIRVIDRPHGQHSVILAEDVPKFLDYSGERNEHGGIVAGSRQIYLTFPAESTFTEQDVSNYFCKFGPVQDVRIPCQQKRMFGFVTFVYAETVKHILAKGNPHFICGARVLVKPYREKSRSVDRKYIDKMFHGMHYGSQFIDRDTEMNSLPPRAIESSRLLRRQFLAEQENSISKSLPRNCSYLRNSSHVDANAEQAERFGYLLDVLNSDSMTEDKVMNISTNYKDTDSQGLNLPESPFSSLSGTEISTVT